MRELAWFITEIVTYIMQGQIKCGIKQIIKGHNSVKQTNFNESRDNHQ